jgi:peptide/nickel transport system ATP-binding protein
VRICRVSFRSERGIIRILENVSFNVREREILSRRRRIRLGQKHRHRLPSCGSITDPNAIITGSIRYKGRDLLALSAREMRRPARTARSR